MKVCLVVVDYQNDFVCGSLGFAKAVELEDKIAKKIKLYRKTATALFLRLTLIRLIISAHEKASIFP